MATKEELLAKRADREAKLAQEAEAHEMLCLELEDKWSAELGLRGRAFEIVNEENVAGVGPIVVKLPTLAAQKAYQRSDAKDSPEVAQIYVKPCVVYPAPDVLSGILNDRHQLCLRCCLALTRLAGYYDEDAVKKS